MLNLDTHVLIHALAGSLTPRERALLSRESLGVFTHPIEEHDRVAEDGELGGDQTEVVRLARPALADYYGSAREDHRWQAELPVSDLR